MLADLAIVLFLAGFMVVGLFRGALRQLLALGGWLVTFVVAAQGRGFIADYLRSREPDFSVQYAQMLGFFVGFVILFAAALAIIELSRSTVTLSARPILEDVLGGAVMVVVGLLFLAAGLIALGSYYAAPNGTFTAEIEQVRQLHVALSESRIVGVLNDTLVPWIQSLLGPLLPPDVRHFG